MASTRRLPMATLAARQHGKPRPPTVAEDTPPPSERSPSVAGDSDSVMSQTLSELSLAGSQTRWGCKTCCLCKIPALGRYLAFWADK